MHIPENYLSPQTCAVMGAIMLPIWYKAVKEVEVKVKEAKEAVPMMGMMTSLSFLMMMFNLPAPGGTTAHAVGAVLIAILMGPWTATLSVSIALAIQAFLFGDGGILAFGANCFTMAFVMPFTGYAVYRLLSRFHYKKLGAFLGGYVGINLAALTVAILLGIQPILFQDSNGNPLYNPYPLSVTIPAMMLTHLLIGLVEGAFTVGVVSFVEKSQDKSAAASSGGKKKTLTWLLALIAFLILCVPLGLLASGTAFAEWDVTEIVENLSHYHLKAVSPKGMLSGFNFNAIMPDYTIQGLPDPIAYILCAASAVVVFFLLFKVLFGMRKSSK